MDFPTDDRFFNHTKILKQVLFFFTGGKKTYGAHTRSVRPMKAVHRSVFIRQTDRVYRALDVYLQFRFDNIGAYNKASWQENIINENNRHSLEVYRQEKVGMKRYHFRAGVSKLSKQRSGLLSFRL